MNFTCPYCGHHSTITLPNRDDYWHAIDIAAEYLTYKHRVGLKYSAIACPNNKCKKLVLQVELTKSARDGQHYNWAEGTRVQLWQLLPESLAKPQPTYIPKPIIADYNEACRIIKLSPKSSAALARRSLQGMIRDFWGISKNRLIDEINELQTKVSADTWDAIDAVRSVGNIGAHMEKDVNIIVDIDPDEAELLISLIEDLFIDWYVTRHDRQERNTKLQELAITKAVAKKKPAPVSKPAAKPKTTQ